VGGQGAGPADHAGLCSATIVGTGCALIVVPAARHALDALEDSAVLLTVSTPAAQPVPR
jgi:quercetin dioxygenase-like cupin family protein